MAFRAKGIQALSGSTLKLPTWFCEIGSSTLMLSKGDAMISRHTGRMLSFCALVSVVLQMTGISFAQDHPPKAKIVITMSVDDRAGNSQIRATTYDDITLKVGDTRNAFLYCNSDGSGAIFNDSPIGNPGNYYYLWVFEVRLVSIAVDRVTFELAWQQTELTGGVVITTGGDRRTFTLGQRENQQLAFMNSNGVHPSTRIQVQASPIEDQKYADLRLGSILFT
jgi:hypothetical protein